jgi:uncharacterized peroxidase-related enzyme
VRLAALESGHRLRARAFLALVHRLSGEEVDDVFKTVLYRPALFGGPAWVRLLRAAMRGPSMWTPGERELFAAATSQANACRFCADAHCLTTSMLTALEVTTEVLAAGAPAGARREVAAMLGLIRNLGADNDLVRPEDVDEVRRAGVSDEGIADALAVVFLFDVLNRLADALGYSWDSDGHRVKGAEALVRFGYRVPTFLLR